MWHRALHQMNKFYHFNIEKYKIISLMMNQKKKEEKYTKQTKENSLKDYLPIR